MDKFTIDGKDIREMGFLQRIFWLFWSPFYITAMATWVFFLGVGFAIYSPFYILYTILEEIW